MRQNLALRKSILTQQKWIYYILQLLVGTGDQTHSVITSIVKNILEEAILEINEEIEKFQNSATEVSTHFHTHTHTKSFRNV